ncbi:MAG: ABC transporter permease [Treponema sp.]|nr:ABC transporter permease [Treponema sp.]
MKTYILKRILMLIPVMFTISILVFFLIRILPGDVISDILGIEQTPENRAILERQFNFDRPVPQQYLMWITDILRGDFGVSLRTGRPILPDFVQRFKVTIELALIASIIAWIISIPLGILSALKRNSISDFFIRIFGLLGVSVPNFAFATLLILVLALGFNYYPPIAWVDFTVDPLRNLQTIIWPALVLGSIMAGSVMRMTRSAMLDNLRQDFIKTIRAKGAGPRLVIFKHALKNSLIPIITIIGMQMGALLGGTVVIEQIFSLPGVGQMTLDAIFKRDYPIVQANILMLAGIYVLINLFVDLMYAVIDPRVTLK